LLKPTEASNATSTSSQINQAQTFLAAVLGTLVVVTVAALVIGGEECA